MRSVFLVALAACAVCAAAQEAPPPETAAPSGDLSVRRQGTYVNFNFDQVDVRLLVKLVGEITGRRFVIDRDVEGKVTVVTPSQITADEVYPLFLAVLDASGFAVVEQDGICRVVMREKRAMPVAPVVAGESGAAAGAGLITKVLRLQHVSAMEIKRMLEPMLGGDKAGALAALETTNHLLVTDTPENIRRLETIIAQIDQAGAARLIELYPLRYAAAANMADELNQAISGVGAKTDSAGERIRRRLAQGEAGAALIADAVVVAAPHSNSLILAGTPAQVAELKRLIGQLDVEPRSAGGHLQAIFLKYLSAEEAAKSLTALLTRSAGEKSTVSSSIGIQANVANNALLVDAAPQDFEMVRRLIESLDLPPPQVLVEVMIAEVTLGKGHDFGVELLASGNPAQDSTVLVGGSRVNEGDDKLLEQVMNGVVPQGLTFGVAKGSYTDANGNVIPRFPALINLQAAKYDSNFKILSHVPLWAQNNQEASVTIGKNIPILKSTIQGGSGTSRDVIENIDRIDVGIKLKVTPQVNPDGEVLMRLNPSIEAIIESSTEGRAFTPTIARREVSTTLTVSNGNTIVISGLIREDNVTKERRVPILGSIPLLGWLFRHSVKELERTNLLIFVTPIVARTREEAAALSERWREQAGEQAVTNAVVLPAAQPSPQDAAPSGNK